MTFHHLHSKGSLKTHLLMHAVIDYTVCSVMGKVRAAQLGFTDLLLFLRCAIN